MIFLLGRRGRRSVTKTSEVQMGREGGEDTFPASSARLKCGVGRTVVQHERRQTLDFMERETGVEPATSSLGSWHSTTELLPPRVGSRLLNYSKISMFRLL